MLLLQQEIQFHNTHLLTGHVNARVRPHALCYHTYGNTRLVISRTSALPTRQLAYVVKDRVTSRPSVRPSSPRGEHLTCIWLLSATFLHFPHTRFLFLICWTWPPCTILPHWLTLPLRHLSRCDEVWRVRRNVQNMMGGVIIVMQSVTKERGVRNYGARFDRMWCKV